MEQGKRSQPETADYVGSMNKHATETIAYYFELG